MVEKGIRGGICHSICRYAKANNKYMKDYDKNMLLFASKNYLDANNIYGWVMSQKLPVNNFEWINDTFHFNEGFIKKYNEESNEKKNGFRGGGAVGRTPHLLFFSITNFFGITLKNYKLCYSRLN